MSAIELFRSRVEQSAKAAAGAAMQLSSLDDMAQKDDYVQSEGLRVSEKKKMEYSSSASPHSENSEFPSVVEDLSERFVDAFSSAARKHNRPRSEREINNASSKADSRSRPSDVEVAGKRENQLGGDINQSTSVPQQPKSKTQKPQLISSVAELYDKNNDLGGTPKQSASKGGRQKEVSRNVNMKQGNLHGSSAGRSSKSSQSKLSLSTIPSSPGQRTNVLLVNQHHAHILHELDYDSDTDSSDDEIAGKSKNDIEMGRLGNAALHQQLEQELEETITRQNSKNGRTNDKKEKDVHRFMKMTADLESEREVLLKSRETVPESAPTKNSSTMANSSGQDSWDKLRGTAGEDTKQALRAGFAWVKNVASPQLEAISKQIMTKVSEADNIRKSTTEQRPKSQPMIGPRHLPSSRKDFEEEKFTVSTSTSFLADEDMAELERIRQRNSTSKLKVAIQMCIDNPRLAFIAVTLFFALFAYFYSRHKSVDDVL